MTFKIAVHKQVLMKSRISWKQMINSYTVWGSEYKGRQIFPSRDSIISSQTFHLRQRWLVEFIDKDR